MVETGEGSVGRGSHRPPRRPAPPAPRFGTVEITVNLEALCWDTFADDGSDTDRPLQEASVSLMPAAGGISFATTDANGIARFENVPVGHVRVNASKTDHVHDDTHPSANLEFDLAAGATVQQTTTLRSADLVCRRKHVAKPAGAPGPVTLGPMFWADEPWILLIRDIVWLVMLLASIALTIVGLAVPGASACLPAGVLCLGVFAYANHVTFGLVPGVIVMALAFAAFLALVVFTILSMLPTPPLPVMDGATGTFGMPRADIFFFPSLCGMWLAFAIGIGAGRQAEFSNKNWTITIIAMIASVVLTIVVFVIIYYFTQTATFVANPDYVVWACLAQLVAGAVTGLIGGLLGHVFVNDGQLDPAQAYGVTDLALPFAGERYCVQGHHGFISHFFRRWQEPNRAGVMTTWTTDEEFSYDWSLPLGHPFLCAKEGHIVAFREDKDGNTMSSPSNDIANYVYVKHRDGTVAHYLHLQQGGFTAVNPAIAALKGTLSGDEYVFDGNPVHCWEGQQLAATGNVGISMFSHLHFQVHLAARENGRATKPVKFSDVSVAIHEGRCFSMRKYRADNVDRGPVQVR